jgi:hypothetical protein
LTELQQEAVSQVAQLLQQQHLGERGGAAAALPAAAQDLNLFVSSHAWHLSHQKRHFLQWRGPLVAAAVPQALLQQQQQRGMLCTMFMLTLELLLLHGMLQQQQQQRLPLCSLVGGRTLVSCRETAFAVLQILRVRQQQWKLQPLAALRRAAPQVLLLLQLLAQCLARTKQRKEQDMQQHQQLRPQQRQLQPSHEGRKSAT